MKQKKKMCEGSAQQAKVRRRNTAWQIAAETTRCHVPTAKCATEAIGMIFLMESH
jgi:hypothetical protein